MGRGVTVAANRCMDPARVRLVPVCCPKKDVVTDYANTIVMSTPNIVRETVGKFWNSDSDVWVDENTIRDLPQVLLSEIVRFWYDTTNRLSEQFIESVREIIRHYRWDLRVLDLNCSLRGCKTTDTQMLMRKLDGVVRGTAYRWQLDVVESHTRRPAMYRKMTMMRAQYTFMPTDVRYNPMSDVRCDVCHLVHAHDERLCVCHTCNRGFHAFCVGLKEDEGLQFHQCPRGIGCSTAHATATDSDVLDVSSVSETEWNTSSTVSESMPYNSKNEEDEEDEEEAELTFPLSPRAAKQWRKRVLDDESSARRPKRTAMKTALKRIAQYCQDDDE